MWKQINPNPCGRFVGDCVIRACSILLDQSWERTYLELCATGFFECDMPSSNHVWGVYLEKKGFDCYPMRSGSIRTVSQELKHGRYLLATGEHVVAVIDGDYYDAWDSGDEYPIFIWKERS